MVNISAKETSERSATAKTMILMQPRTKPLIKEGGLKKGDVLGVARLAGIMAAKQTADLYSLVSAADAHGAHGGIHLRGRCAR